VTFREDLKTGRYRLRPQRRIIVGSLFTLFWLGVTLSGIFPVVITGALMLMSIAYLIYAVNDWLEERKNPPAPEKPEAPFSAAAQAAARRRR
jgi:hypothetical protein